MRSKEIEKSEGKLARYSEFLQFDSSKSFVKQKKRKSIMSPFKFPPYAFSSITNELVHIDSVANGLKCNCYCKECGGKLIARNRGEVKVHHFAHDGNSSCNMGETFLHHLVKNYFAHKRAVYLPTEKMKLPSKLSPKLLRFPDHPVIDPRINVNRSLSQEALQKFGAGLKWFGAFYPIHDVRIENRFDSIIPDVVCQVEYEGHLFDLFIEVAVTHFVDANKLQKIKSHGITCVEIDLSKFVRFSSDDLWDKETLAAILSNSAIYSFKNQAIVDTSSDLTAIEQAIAKTGYANICTGYTLNEDSFVDVKLTDRLFVDREFWSAHRSHIEGIHAEDERRYRLGLRD